MGNELNQTGGEAPANMGEPQPPVGEAELLYWAERLAAIARTGLGFSDSLFECERYEEVLEVAAQIRQASPRGIDPKDQIEEWMDLVGHRAAGYVTPKTTIGALVMNDDGELLLVKRGDSGYWLFPTGWADVGFSPSEVAVKEVFEETGIVCEPVALVRVMDGMRAGFTGIPLFSMLFLCKAVGGVLQGHPLETQDLGFFAETELPEPLAGRGRWVPGAFKAIADHRGGADLITEFDLVRHEVVFGQDTHWN